METKKLIVLESYGDHSNRLLQSINYEAFCRENNIFYVNPSFKNMVSYYEGCRLCHPGYYMIQKVFSFNVIGRVLRKLKITKGAFMIGQIFERFGFIKIIKCDICSVDYTNVLLKAFEMWNTVYVTGWFFWPLLVQKHTAFFHDKYKLKEKYFLNNTMYHKIMKLKKEKTLIGIHIRRGNYKRSKFYYDNETYHRFIENMKQIIKGSCVFIIFSNEDVGFEEDMELYISKETWYIDQYLMSQCDYLIGPPSTFTKWASYINNVKCYHIQNAHDEIKISDFIVHKN